ncbi:MAG: alpha/beta hydrolase [Candidatus Woesearchaeota archaeon]
MRIRKKTLWITGILIVVVLVFLFVYYFPNRDPYIRGADTFSYSKYRNTPDFQLSLLQQNDSFDLYKVSFPGRTFLENKITIFGLLVIPHSHANVPGVLLLPGGGVTKEAELPHCRLISSWGYACLVIDQRGIGETAGIYLSFEDDYNVFLQGKEPIQHLSVYDALAAFDVMRSIGGIDSIAVAGLSMGGRYAIIAGALEPRFAGVVSIASAGFHIKEIASVEAEYVKSIDPDSYVAMISPRPFVMLHGTNDSTVPIDEARVTFSIAKEPKKFYTADGCGHGLCEGMYQNLSISLKEIFSQ